MSPTRSRRPRDACVRMARCLPRYRQCPLPCEYMFARAQDKAGKAREDSLSEEQRQANLQADQAKAEHYQRELRTTKATDVEIDDECLTKLRKFAPAPNDRPYHSR